MSKKTLTWILGIALLLLPMCAGTFESVASAEPAPREAEDASRTPTTQQGDTNQLAETDAGLSPTSAPADSTDVRTWLSENKDWLGIVIALSALLVTIVGLPLVRRSKRPEEGSPRGMSDEAVIKLVKTMLEHASAERQPSNGSNEQQQNAHSEEDGPITQTAVRDVGGNLHIGNTYGDVDGKKDVLDRLLGAHQQIGQLQGESEQLKGESKQQKRQLADAVRRAEVGGQKGEQQAIVALAAVRKTGDTELLLKYLLAQREAGVGDPAELNREIAAVAFLRGEISIAQTALVQILDVLPDDMSAINMTGVIHALRGDLEKAQAALERILELAESAEDPQAQAVACGNLGILFSTRGELDKAEEMHNKSLDLSKQLGRKKGMAAQYGNLGILHFMRGDLDKAEEMYNKALDLNKQLGRKEGMACDYGNLGLVYATKGELDTAAGMYNKALDLNKQLGRKEGMAIQYGNLGNIYMARGELDKAEEMHLKSLEIEKQLGHKEGMASDYGNLGIVYMACGELSKTEEMYNKALELFEQLGSKEGMATACGNLGVVYEQRGELGKAREYWILSRDLFNEIGMPHMVEKVQGWIDELDAAQ